MLTGKVDKPRAQGRRGPPLTPAVPLAACSLSALFSPQCSQAAAGASNEKHMFLGSRGVAQGRPGEGEGEKGEGREEKSFGFLGLRRQFPH